MQKDIIRGDRDYLGRKVQREDEYQDMASHFYSQYKDSGITISPIIIIITSWG